MPQHRLVQPAFQYGLRPLCRVRRAGGGAQPLQFSPGTGKDPQGAAGGDDRLRHRHPPPALLRREIQGPGAARARRGAALRGETKEKIKNLRKDIDCLTMTATPIPRTLHMSLSGIRDISTIQTPPGERLPVQTYVVEETETLIRDACIRELSRKGQVFVLYNKVESIFTFAAKLKRILPEAEISVAHGRMDKTALENSVFDFYSGRSDVLVTTTIIENGIDLPNANTLIVIDADRLGISQLYQLRGRVGRGTRLAHAYFTFKPERVMTQNASERLKAIMEFTELGSGYKLAMRDLEIRGAGNVLGAEQHGHMDRVGYELYAKLLKEELTGGIADGGGAGYPRRRVHFGKIRRVARGQNGRLQADRRNFLRRRLQAGVCLSGRDVRPPAQGGGQSARHRRAEKLRRKIQRPENFGGEGGGGAGISLPGSFGRQTHSRGDGQIPRKSAPEHVGGARGGDRRKEGSRRSDGGNDEIFEICPNFHKFMTQNRLHICAESVII